MIGLFDKIPSLLNLGGAAVRQFRTQEVTAALGRLRAYLTGGQNPVVRVYADAGGGSGQQAAAVRLLDRLFAPANAAVPGLAYTGDNTLVELVYRDDVAATVDTLRRLMQWPANQNNGQYNGGNVTLVPWSARSALNPANVCLSGACDTASDNEGHNMAEALQVQWFLRLQPFMYAKPDELQFAAPAKAVDLSAVAELGGASFHERGLKLEVPPPAFNWDPYTGSQNADIARRSLVARWLIANMAGNFDLLVTYGIHTATNSAGNPAPSAISTDPYDQATLLVSGAQATQRTADGPAAGARPIVILNLDDFYFDAGTGATADDRFAPVLSALRGGYSVAEARQFPPGTHPPFNRVQQAIIDAKAARSTYFNTVNAAPRVRFISKPDTAGNAGFVDVSAEVNNWLLVDTAAGQSPQPVPRQQKLLWVQLGGLPPPPFDYILSRSTLPPVFEGNNTTNLAVNFGWMYYRVVRSPDTNVMYPTKLLEARPRESFLRRLQDAANVPRQRLSDWPTNLDFARVPPEIFAKPIRTYRAEQATGTYRAYFQGVAAFYNDPANDKLNLALAYLAKFAAPPPQQLAPAAAPAPPPQQLAPAAAPAPPLDALYAALSGALSDEQLPLLPGALPSGWQLSALLQTLVPKQPLTLTGATLTREPAEGDPITKVTATGAAGWFGDPAQATLQFTAPGGKVQTEVDWTWKAKGSFGGLDWLVMEEPTLSVAVSEDASLTYGGFGVHVKVGELGVELAWRFPTPDDAWLMTATFEHPPSAGAFFAFAGGIDLSNLPAPFNVLTSLGLRSLAIAYDPTRRQVGSLAFSLRNATDTPVPLVGSIELGGISIDTTIEDPTGTRAVSTAVAARFDIGDPTGDHAVIDVGATAPQLTFTGVLAQGPLGLLDLVKAFLPPDMAGDLPFDPDPQPKLTQFSFAYDQAQQKTSVSVAIDTTIKPALCSFTPLEIDSVGLAMTHVRDTVDVGVYGSLVLLPNSASPLDLLATSTYETGQGWTFSAQQTDDPVDLAALAKEYLHWDVGESRKIDGLFLSIAQKDGSWLFTGKTAKPWHIDFLNLDVAASLRLGYNGKSAMAAAHPAVAGSTLELALADNAPGAFGRIEADVRWMGIEVTTYYDYSPAEQSFGLRWDGLQGSVTQSKDPAVKGDWTAQLGFTDDVTLGSLIERMVSWVTGTTFGLEAPWNVLDDIKLSGVALIYTFNTTDASRNHVSFKVDIGPIDLGFARIDGIDVRYQDPPVDGNRVAVTLTGSFPWNVGDGAPGDAGKLGPWDASSPGSAPAPPGQGGKYIDLRFLALGQHVTVEKLPEAETVKDAIDLIRQLPPTKRGEVPSVQFDPASDWLVGMDFGVLRQDGGASNGGGKKAAPAPMAGGNPDALVGDVLPALRAEAAAPTAPPAYFISLQAVFNDPHLYGLRVALDGEAAKILKGLEFEIMYRQLTDVLGVYQAEITLPDAMRKFDVGAYSLTLPIISFAYYTNGDFLIDIGFPHNNDFSRSFRVEGIIYPGIPVLGAGGFYFGKLPEAATDKVPSNPARGTFNPIVVFGFGLQVGFGKSVQYGVLSAGFSLTVFGIIEGVVAKWNPYAAQLPETTGGSGQLQGAYYFWLQGTVGILGKLYGSVDFAIIKAQVDVDISLYIQLTYESFVSIALTVVASVHVSVSVKIDLWLFSITLHFSFSLNLKETFAIHNGGTAPWAIEGSQPAGALAGPADRRLAAVRRIRAGLVAVSVAPPMDWTRLASATPEMRPLTGYLMTALTVAADERAPADQSQQAPCYVAMLALDSVAPAALDRETSAPKAAGQQHDSSFETLCKRVLAWVVAAAATDLPPGQPLSYQQVLARPVTDEQLERLLASALVSTDDDPTPIPLDAIEAFLAEQFTLTVTVAPQGGSPANATSFPMPPALKLTLPSYGSGYPGCDYTFGGYNALDQVTLKRLRADFAALLVRVESESGGAPSTGAAVAGGAPLSVGAWVFADFFLLIARQMVQAVRAGLRTFKYPVANGASIGDVITWIDDNGGGTLTVGDVMAANPARGLAAGPVTIGVELPVGTSDSFAALATAVGLVTGSGAIGATELATTNAAGAVLRAGTSIEYPEAEAPYPVEGGDTLITVATHFGAKLGDLLANARASATGNGAVGTPGLIDAPGLLDPTASVLVPLVRHQALAGDSFASIGGDDVVALATANAGRAVLLSGTSVSHPSSGQAHTVAPGECLGDVATAFGVALADLLANATVGAEPLLKAAGVLAPLAVLALPQLQVTATKGETLQAIAAAYGTTVSVLGMAAANAAVAFDGGDPDLDVAHLGELNLGALIDEAQRTNALQHLSGIASRYQLHGLRLRTDGIKPNAPGMWVETGGGGELELPPVAGLHALTGQQFPVPAVQDTDTWAITFDSSGESAWLRFSSGGAPTTQLTIPVTGGTVAATAIANLTAWAHGNRLDVWAGAADDQRQLGPAPMYRSDPARYPFSASIEWQSVAPVALPYGAGPSDPAALRIWSLPDSLAALPDPSRKAVDPRLAVAVARYDEATGATIREPVDAYGWGSAIEFAVKRVPPVAGAPATATTYEVAGASGEDLLLLERLLEQNAGAHLSATHPLLFFGYPPDATGGAAEGIQTDDPAHVTAGIAQVDLSTDTRPAAAAAAALLEAVPGQLLNAPADLLRLLWEASVTRNGGFYLYYYDGADGRGLPDRIFDDRGQAVLTLLALFERPPADPDRNRVGSYMNVLATGTAIEGTNATLYAQADPTPTAETTVPSGATVSLVGLADAYFSDVGDLAAANGGLGLRAGVPLRVTEGLYQAPPEGIAIGDAAARFGTTVTALRAANPNADMPATLTFPLAIRLPELTLTAGMSPSTGTLVQVEGYYGEDATALGADNADVAGLFADAQDIQITGGPRVRTATVPPGAASFAAARPAPASVPADPTDPSFCPDFLAAAFTLLGYAIADNAGFSASPIGIPAGPTVPSEDPQDGDKLRTVPLFAEGEETWTYSLSVPYAPSAKPPSPSPYAGVGEVLQLGFDWLDHFGNRLVTTLSASQPGDAPPLDQPPLLTGYADPLIAVSQWPAVASSWEVLVPPSSGTPAVEVALAFDGSQYSGLLEATATGTSTIDVVFTEAVAGPSAETPANYTVADATDPGDAIAVTGASLCADGPTVTLTVSGLPDDHAFTLSVKGVQPVAGPPGRVFAGTATFAQPDDPHQRSSTVQANAARDLRTYERLLQQLDDPNGVAMSVATTLLVDGDGDPVPRPLTAAQLQDVTGWVASIAAFLGDRAAFTAKVTAPAPVLPVDLAIDPAAVNPAQIFELGLELSIARTGGVVLGDMDTAPGIRSAATVVAPLQQPLGDADTALSLTAFAQGFQDTLSQPGRQLLKVATGVDRGGVAAGRSGATLWCVRVGVVPGQPLSYALQSSATSPAVFAPRPASTTLQSHAGIEIHDYTTGKGLSPTVTRTLDFGSIDMDVWCRQAFAAIDAVLSPRYTAPMQIVGAQDVPGVGKQDWLGNLLSCKEKLATSTQNWMVPVFADQANPDDPTTYADPAPARAAFLQGLLSALSNAYATRAAVGLSAAVTADVQEPLAVLPPNLFGAIGTAGPSFAAATVAPGTPDTVLLRFSDPMDATSAQQPSNYSLSDGTVIAAVSSSTDPRLVTLTLSAAAVPGTTAVTVGAAVVTADGTALRPPLTRDVVAAGTPDVAASLTFSSPKLALAAGDQPLTFLVTGPEVVHDATGEVVKCVDLDLVWAPAAIEHQIGPKLGGGDYRPSTWLTFVITDDLDPLGAELGRLPLPLPLRAFPESTTLTVQTGGADTSATGVDLETLTEWDYTVSYTLPYHYPQDRLSMEVQFNLKESFGAVGGPEDAFAQLAQLVTVLPAVAADLDGALAAIDATTDPVADAGTFTDAAFALQALTSMVGAIADAAGDDGLTAAAPRPRLLGDEDLGYAFTISEDAGTAGTVPDALIVTLTGAPPDGIADPSITIDGYETVVQPASDGDPAAIYRFAFLPHGGSAADYLVASVGQAIPGRSVVLPGMDLLSRQDALASASIERNRYLAGRRASADAFVYTTASVTFPSPLHPYVDRSDAVDISMIGSKTPVSRSLADHLNTLFRALLFDGGSTKADELTFEVEAMYSYSLSPALPEDPVRMPVFLQPPLQVSLATTSDGGTTLDDMAAEWVSALDAWFTDVEPLAGGDIGLDLTIMTNLTAKPMPMLRLRGLYLPAQYVEPPLPLRKDPYGESASTFSSGT